MGFIHHVVRQDNGDLEVCDDAISETDVTSWHKPQFPPSFLAQTRQPQMIVGNIIVQAVGSLIFFARAYSRFAIIKSWKTEDYVLTLAWVCTNQ